MVAASLWMGSNNKFAGRLEKVTGDRKKIRSENLSSGKSTGHLGAGRQHAQFCGLSLLFDKGNVISLG
jgi:hypothetical protein